MEKNSLQTRDGFASRLGIIAAAAGSAIGLGNIWKFPYIVGENGGAAFIIVYLVCIALIGFPVMLSEFIIGRRAQKNAIGSFKKLAPNTPWFLTGWMGVVAAFFILAFYGVVGGWCLDYIFKAAMGSFAGADVGAMFGGFISHPYLPIIWQIVFMALTAGIILGGVKNGIERYAKILMPLLLVIILVLDIRAITLPGAKAGLDFLFKPNFAALTPSGVLTALGHAFFSLSLGMGTMITYGSYIQKKENLADTAIQVTIADTLIALLAGVAIFPAVFAFGIEPGAGPGLVFVTLPNIFNQMPGGYFFGILFFVLLAVAALTSSISILEVVVAYVVEDKGVSRKKATIVGALLITLLGIPCSLANGPMAGVKFINGLNFFDTLDYLSANWLLPLGGLFISLFVAWKLGREEVEAEVNQSGTNVGYLGLYLFLCKWVAPIAIGVVFLHGIGLF